MDDLDKDTIVLSSELDNTITIDSTMAGDYYSYGTQPYANITISGAGASGSFLTSNGLNGTSWTTNNTSPWSVGNITPNPGLKVSGDAEFEGTVTINGQDISEFMETISKRLTILVPDPEKLEHFEALKKAYEHYKVLEALCQLPTKEEK